MMLQYKGQLRFSTKCAKEKPTRCSSLEVDLPGGRGTAVSFEWTPGEAGEAGFILELVIPGREDAPDIYPGNLCG